MAIGVNTPVPNILAGRLTDNVLPVLHKRRIQKSRWSNPQRNLEQRIREDLECLCRGISRKATVKPVQNIDDQTAVNKNVFTNGKDRDASVSDAEILQCWTRKYECLLAASDSNSCGGAEEMDFLAVG